MSAAAVSSKQIQSQHQQRKQSNTTPSPPSPSSSWCRRLMKSRAAKKAAADEDEIKSTKIRSSRRKRRHGRRSRSSSGSDSPPRKRSKKSTKRTVDKKSKKDKGTRRRLRSLSPSRSPSSRSTSRSSSSASERSVSPPLPRSRSRDARRRKGRGRDREKDRKRRRTRRSRSYSSTSASSGSSRSRSRKQRAGGTRDDASRDEIVKDYDNCRASWTEKNSAEDVGRDEEAVAVSKKGMNDIDEHVENVGLEKMEESPLSKDSNEMGEILPSKDDNETDKIIPAGSGSPEAEEDLELILRQKALENFRKFRGAAVMADKTDSNDTGKEVLVTKIAEARSTATPFQGQGSSLGVSHSAGSPELEDFRNGTSPWKQEMSRGDRSPGILEAGDTSAPTQQQGNRLEAIRSTSHIRSHDGRNGGSVMQRLGSTPASSASVKRRLGSSAGASPVSATPRVRSVVSIPAREGLDGSTFTTTPTACENLAPVESSSEVRHPPVEINKLEGTNGDDRKTSEASAPESSVLSTDEGKSQAGAEDKDGSQFEKRTFSRMHDGETVQVSYKVYIPTKSPRLARRKLQR